MVIKVLIFICIILLVLCLWGWIKFWRCKKLNEGPNNKKKHKEIISFILKNWKTLLWILRYIVLTILSTIFVIKHWDKCLDISFFNKFNGYNIIWILWLFLLFIPLISVDNQWFKIVNPFTEKEREIDNAKGRQQFSNLQSSLNELNDGEGTKGDDN